MRVLVHKATLLAVTIHMMGGCCWHHAHAEAGEGHGTGHSEAHRCAGDTDSDHGHHCGGGRPSKGHDDHGCEMGRCLFVVLNNGRVVKQTRLGTPIASSVIVAVSASAVERQFPALEPFSSSRWGALRIHLLNQVLLH